MSPPEIAFLALGLIVGAATGAAFIEALRARPVPRREVRLTVSPNSIVPRRAATLASADPLADRGSIPGSPADEEWLERRLAGVGIRAAVPVTPAVSPAATRTRVPSSPVSVPASAVAVPVGPARTPAGTLATAVPVRAQRSPEHADGAPAATMAREATAVALLDRTVAADAIANGDAPVGRADNAGSGAPTVTSDARAEASGEPAASGDRPGGATKPAGTTSCEAERHLVEERCALAEAAREQARVAAEALRLAQRAYDDLRERVDRAQAMSDPREIRAAKDALHRTFRSARAAATTPAGAEEAARDWLTEINRLNTAAREAAHVAATGSEQLRQRHPELERLAVEADAARITAESADAGCRDARIALARCEEQAAQAAAAAPVPEPVASTLDGVWPTEPETPLRSPAPSELASSDQPPPVIRLLRGERQARDRLVAGLSGDDPEGVRQWQLRIAAFVDAVAARAIEDGYLALPEEGFWGLFARREQRDIVAALSALGFRFDGMAGFADGRVPAQRDLSLAVGYAGLDRMRIRAWPREAELADLYAGAQVAADEWLIDQAGDLSLGRMVDALGGRAAELADLWNAWGRVRPALLGTG